MERRAEDRKRRELKNKQFLDKKYSILEQDSDDSLSYDGTNIVKETKDQIANPMDDPVPTIEDIGSDSAIGTSGNSPTNLNTQRTHPNINVQSTQQNTVTIPKVTQNDPPKSTFQVNTQPNSSKNQSVPSSANQPPNSPVQNQTVVTNQPPTCTANFISQAQPVASNSVQLTNQQQSFASNSHSTGVMSAPTNNQTVINTTDVASNVSNAATKQMNTSNTLTHQPIMSSNFQTASTTQQPGIAQAASMNNSPVPDAGYQSNQRFTYPGAMHLPYAPHYYTAAAAPNSQMIQNPGGVRQLTAEQIASRQVVPRDLPIFYGDAEDWTKFFSVYQNSTTVCGYNNSENLGRLQKALKGDAEEAVRSLLVHADAVPEIIRTLFLLFGRPEIIIDKMITDIHKEQAPKDDDLASILKFAIKVKNLSHSIRNTGVMEHLRNPTLINAITDKLPAQMQLRWAYHKQAVGYTDLGVLGDWLSQIAEAASLVVRRSIKTSSKKKEQQKDQQSSAKPNPSSTKPNTYVNTQVENTSEKWNYQSATKFKTCPACNNSSCSKLSTCNKFKEMNRSDKSLVIKENKLCTRCLGGHHFFRCRSNLVCKVEGCKAKHHTLLHNPEKPSETPNVNSNQGNGEKTSPDKFSTNASHTNNTVSRPNDRIDIFRIVPITVFGKQTFIHMFAYLDDGSNMTTMEASLSNELNLKGTSAPICVDWAFGYTHSVESKTVSVRISGRFNGSEQYELDNVRTVKELHLPTQSISQQWLDQYKHLRGLPITTYESVKPRMLIGLQYSRLTVSLKTIEGNVKEPLACKTRLGWVVQGPSYDQNNQLERKYSMNMCECQSHDIKLHQLVKEYFLNENLDVKIPNAVLESNEIQRAKQIMEATTSKKDGRYETGLLWKYDRIELPDSYPMALKRLQCLESKMSKNPQLADNLRNQFRQFVDKGYIRKLTPEELETKSDSPTWYLPTFPAFNPKKPEKVRIVWDGAAKVMKISLNSVLLTGPDQLIPLPDILRRFRERLIAMIGDIKEMYHQIKVIKADQNAQRFLWRDGDSSRKPDVYVMLVVSFGLTCSPSQAQFIKNKNALEFIKEFPEAVNTIINNHYVDDMLDSEHTVDAAEKRIKEVKFIHQEGGFEIRNFISNSKELLRRIGENTESGNRNMNISVELGTERVLGMFWNMETDCFTFSLKFTRINENILFGKQCPTKREVLRTLMSVFDPLGLLANYLIHIKILIQHIWRSNVDWDEEVTPSIFNKWLAWIKTLPSVENIQIPRLYSPKLSPNAPNSIQLHIFVDAIEEAYATAIYLRIEDDDGIDCCLVGAKTKVAPNKPTSTPRLELQGAVLGTRLASSIKSSQTLKFDKQVFWTDSQNVMGWVNSEARKYKQFVAFRICEILESSDQNEWRWIPSEHNVADEATKSKEIARLDSSSRWYKAPEFLYDKEEDWFKDQGDIEYFTENEVRPSFSMACREIIRPQIIDIERFSQWNRLVRAQAYALRFIFNVRHSQQERQFGPLVQQEILDAENHLYRRAQSDCFLDEIVVMKHNQNRPLKEQKDFEKSSILRTYSPYIDEDGVIRMRGRSDAATVLSHDTKRPIILPRRHRITRLIVDYYHRRYKHINHSTVLNQIQQKFIIPALRVVLKSIRTSCQKCKNLSAEPKIPEMAELPPGRLAAYTLPFTFVGIDFFGPIRVRNGRKTRNRPVIMEKRWVLLFTCLTTRAIWMEITHSLETNSCVMAIDNFISRKGQSKRVFCDNGTSFHGSEKELRDEFSKINQRDLAERFTSSEMEFRFNPPATPHMGGVWERLIRTVKSCLKQTMLTRCPNDEMLKNLIVSAENIVNLRPLTYVALESADEEALTPNHILLGSSNGRKPLGEFPDKDLARNTYKAVQILANNFWRRFVLEYMPTLTKRTKWFKQMEPIKVGDVVIVVDERNERNTWPKGIVEKLMPDKRGIVRQVMVRTAKGIRRRSVGKLAVLDVKPPMEDVNQDSMVSIHGEGNVGQQHMTGNTDLHPFHSATGLPDSAVN
ncbi:uncharacterized protein LOC119069388 [Bradysia coprophila]|uniref:uncharacterized protein LOC119069388 n=1 Tax=Bradysia coprophila TaxID=38358 RepID=UPI00187DC7DC|nr:uncharacterized protein LOC119069388 [Bradysia coprophila]